VALHIYRIVVHGSFRNLDDDMRARLRADAAHHEPASTRFTRDGHLTYDANLRGFSFRYEVRERSDDRDGADGAAAARQAATERAVTAASDWLASRDLEHSELRTRVSDMADVWR
jgi:hypothetical protein